MATARTFRVIREGVVEYGVAGKCQGCKGTEREWKRPMAHPTECRNTTTKERLNAGDPEEGVKVVTELVLTDEWGWRFVLRS